MLIGILLASVIAANEPAATKELPAALLQGVQVMSRDDADKVRGSAYHAGIGGRVPTGYRCTNAFVSSSKAGRVSVLCKP